MSELGLRGSWRQPLRYDVAVYHMHKDNVIFQDANSYNVSGAQTRHYGAELSVDYMLSDNWSVGIDGNMRQPHLRQSRQTAGHQRRYQGQ